MAIVGETGVTTFSKLPIAPSKKSLLNDVFRSERKKEMAKSNPLFYGDRKPRLASARELLVCELPPKNATSNPVEDYYLAYFRWI